MLLKLIHIGIITFGVASIAASYQPQVNAIHICLPDKENSKLEYTHHKADDLINKKIERILGQNKNEKQKYIISEREVCGINVSKLKIESNKTELKNRWDIKLNIDEIDVLAKIVWVESRGECDKGQQAVVETILIECITGILKGLYMKYLVLKTSLAPGN